MKILSIIFSFLIINICYAKLNIMVSIEPIAYLVEKIGGNKVQVLALIDEGKDPHTYSPSPSQIKSLNNSNIFFHVNAPFESILINKINKDNDLKIIGLDEGIKKRKMKSHNHDKIHKNHSKSSLGLDPHIWLSTQILKKMVTSIEKNLVSIDIKNTDYFKNNKEKFFIEMNQNIDKVQNLLRSIQGKEVLVFHPAFGYFLEENGLKQIPIEIEGKIPSPKHIVHIINKAKEHKIKVIFIQPQFSKKAAMTISNGIKGSVMSINALEKNILNNFLIMAKKIKEAYQK